MSKKLGENVSKSTFLSEEYFKTTENLLHLKKTVFAGFVCFQGHP